MAKKNIIDAVEGSKVWGYVAMGAAILAGAAIVITVKESMDAKKAAKNLALAKEELESVKEAVTNGGEVEEVQEIAEESFSGIDKGAYSSNRGFVSSFRPLRQTYTESSSKSVGSKWCQHRSNAQEAVRCGSKHSSNIKF